MKKSINTFPRFTIYLVDNETVGFTVSASSKSIKFSESVLKYRFRGIPEDVALTLYQMVSVAHANGASFFGKTAEAVNAYCRICGVETPVGTQCYK